MRRRRWLSEPGDTARLAYDWESSHLAEGVALSRRSASNLVRHVWHSNYPANRPPVVSFRRCSPNDLGYYDLRGHAIVLAHPDVPTICHELTHALCWRRCLDGEIACRDAVTHSGHWVAALTGVLVLVGHVSDWYAQRMLADARRVGLMESWT